jgi:hypothetical protein
MSAPWWIWRPVQTRLSKWTLALLQGKRYRIDLSPNGTGYHDSDSKVIHANPEMFPKEADERKFRLTQGILAHEVGHALFTNTWPTKSENVLRQMVNILEDQRIERAIAVLYPGVEPAIRELGDLCYADISALEDNDLLSIEHEDEAAYRVVQACLAWRWAHARTNALDMLRRVGLAEHNDAAKDGRKLWRQVLPLVEASWSAQHTGEVIKLAREILEILGLPEGYPAITLPSLWGDLPISRSDNPLPFPNGPSKESPGMGLPPKEIAPAATSGSARMVLPDEYIELEDAALPLAKRLAESLKLPAPDVRLRPEEMGGRYSFRQEIRTPDTPFLRRTDRDLSARSLAMCLLVDRSGSMGHVEHYVRLAAMMLYLACQELDVPIAAAYFGDGHKTIDPVDEVIAFGDRGEWPKSMIAGYSGHTGAEYLDFGLQWAEELLAARPERLRTIIVVHDGQPVATWHDGGCVVSDWDVSLNHIRSLERKGIPVIGVYLDDNQDCAEKMRELFLRLVVCRAEELPDKLGNLLRSLA